MSNIESNKMIAEFMGYKYFPFDENKKSDNPDIIIDQMNGWHKPTNGHYKIHGWYLCRTHRDLAYDYKWNWLMLVVEKIENIGAIVQINQSTCNIWHPEQKCNPIHIEGGGISKINAVYMAVVDFIEWYNLNSKTPLSIIKNNG